MSNTETSSFKMINLLIVEDDQTLAQSLKLMAPEGYKVWLAAKPQLVPDHVFYHAALVDLHLEAIPPNSADGLSVIQKLSKKNPQTEIVAMSGNLDRKLMEKSILAGAHKFLAKPLSAEEVTSVLDKILAYWSLRQSIFNFQFGSSKLIGQSPQTELLRKQISRIKGEKGSVLVEGETGVGKEIAARLLNLQEGSRPFISVNCSAVPENLFESEFFGHVKGAFTGADHTKIGYAEAAHGGDLFLDEIEVLPLTQQAKLLRFLESGEFKKVGGKEIQTSETRVIAASNEKLADLVKAKKFREDLYFRLKTHSLEIAPLRQRPDDIVEIAKAFIDADKARRNKTFEDSAFEALKSYSWPGNVRELKRVCEQLSLTSPLPIIRDVDVKKLIFQTALEVAPIFAGTELPLDDFILQQERDYITSSLQRFKDVEVAASKLKISKSTLYKKIKDLGINYE